MKHKILIIGILVITFLATALLAVDAYASTGCFSDTVGIWAEEYICWLKDNGISNGFGDGNYHPYEFVSRDQMAKFLKLQAEVPPSSGEILVQVGLSDWYVNNGWVNTVMTKNFRSVAFGKPGGGTCQMDASPAVPLALYGHNLALKGMELCYYVNAAAGFLSQVELLVLSVPTFSGSTGIGFIADSTDRTDEACRTYAFAAAVPLDIDSQIIIRLYAESADGTTSPTVVHVGRTTLLLEPTTLSSNLTP